MFTAQNRPIQFPLDRSFVSQRDTPDEAITNYPFTWNTADNDERVTITLTVSLREFIVLSSAIDVGSDVAYGEDAIQVWWLWVKAINTMALCDQITACIQTNAGVQGAITDVVSGIGNGGIPSGGTSGAGAYTTINITNNTTDIMDGSNCSNDNMYAVATQIVALAFDTVLQVFQAIDLAISPIELAAELGDNAPAIATGIPSSAADWAIWIQDTAFDEWNVYDTTQKRIDTACDIFCIMVNQNCSLTFDDIANYFWQKSPVNIQGSDLATILVSMVTLSLSDAIGDTSLAFVFGCLAIGSKIGGLENIGVFLTTLAAYIDETNNNWTIECDPCGNLTYPVPVPTRCEDTLQLGTWTQINDSTWRGTSGVFGTGQFLFIQDNQGRAFSIANIQLQSVNPAINVDYQPDPDPACTRINTTPNGLTSVGAMYGFTMVRGSTPTAFVYDVTFDPLP